MLFTRVVALLPLITGSCLSSAALIQQNEVVKPNAEDELAITAPKRLGQNNRPGAVAPIDPQQEVPEDVTPNVPELDVDGGFVEEIMEDILSSIGISSDKIEQDLGQPLLDFVAGKLQENVQRLQDTIVGDIRSSIGISSDKIEQQLEEPLDDVVAGQLQKDIKMMEDASEIRQKERESNRLDSQAQWVALKQVAVDYIEQEVKPFLEYLAGQAQESMGVLQENIKVWQQENQDRRKQRFARRYVRKQIREREVEVAVEAIEQELGKPIADYVAGIMEENVQWREDHRATHKQAYNDQKQAFNALMTTATNAFFGGRKEDLEQMAVGVMSDLSDIWYGPRNPQTPQPAFQFVDWSSPEQGAFCDGMTVSIGDEFGNEIAVRNFDTADFGATQEGDMPENEEILVLKNPLPSRVVKIKFSPPVDVAELNMYAVGWGPDMYSITTPDADVRFTIGSGLEGSTIREGTHVTHINLNSAEGPSDGVISFVDDGSTISELSLTVERRNDMEGLTFSRYITCE